MRWCFGECCEGFRKGEGDLKVEIINFYKKELSVWNMVYRYMNKTALSAYIIGFVLLVISFIWVIFAQKNFWTVLVFLLFLLELVLLNNHNKNILENVYNISKKDQGPTWGGFHFQKGDLKS